jgi:lysozyme family protein
MISKYNEFLLEKEFNEILNDIFLIIESEGVWTSPNTIEWDMTKKPDEKKPDLIDRGLDKLKSFISKLDKDQIRDYYIRLINKLKPLPEKMRKFLITHYTSVFLTVVSLTYLVGGQNETTKSDETQPVKTETIDPKIKKEIVELHKVASFEEAQSAVKEVEAGYSDDRGDTGNWVEVPGYGKRFVGTNHGISAPILQKYLGRIPKREDMENLSYQTAIEIYKKDYWDAQNLSTLCDQSVANVIYDGCVNQGIDGMSEVIRNAASDQNLNLKGSVYSKSNLRRLNSLNQNELFNSIKKFRESRYREAATWNRHGEGWLNRLNGIEYQINNQA